MSVPALTAKEVTYTQNRRLRAASAWAATEVERASKPFSAAVLQVDTSPLAMA